ncbi:MAG: phenylalanine--tRNA ligase subunit beta [Bacteroidetes bacterium]|nr:MAG: phenylalanine--tRNA ligase subunit beta [Bacteroidota bacterium]TAE72155.1 MAG: phenylalanine--tRNA ligase subunit beta [Bacteroidota bacterium]TAF92812.1 MAG: phenylalanine--tRNA ligase subunit beta [Bacteroidota bacterium]
MTISYNWLSKFLPEGIEVDRLSKILTSVGLEVESVELYESIKGSLAGVVVGEVLTCEPHHNADKLKITTVNIGQETPLQVVCGASNVAAQQKVLVATVGSTIYPTNGEPLTMKTAKIRGVESQGMICAEDELGLGTSHDGILVLPANTVVGTPASQIYNPYTDTIFEIGLTANRMDAMSHIGVAKDVCAYLSHSTNKDVKPKIPNANSFKVDNTQYTVQVAVENTTDCIRYAGVSITGITVKPSPSWLVNALQAIGVRSINNVVDVTNYILHETGQPLHAFDMAAIQGNKVVVRNAQENEKFITLDGKERSLQPNNLVIANTIEPMCIAGVFGGEKSGVSTQTTTLFLESACFSSTSIRKTSVQHGLRTDAATRFEKGVDVSQTVNVLKRAALLIKEVAGGEIASNVIDVYATPVPKKEVVLKNHYLKKVSGKNYHPDAVKRILTALGFEIVKESIDEIRVAAPHSKPDIELPADIVEEIVRIDGLDNIPIPQSITITPATETLQHAFNLQEKIANHLTGKGFYEILTNSITNAAYFTEEETATGVKMLNNLSADLNMLRPTLLHAGLESIAYNLNRKNSNLSFFEIGKTYHQPEPLVFKEQEELAVFITGTQRPATWNYKAEATTLFDVKGTATALLELLGISALHFTQQKQANFSVCLQIQTAQTSLGLIGQVSPTLLQKMGIKQPVFYINIPLAPVIAITKTAKTKYKEVPKFPAVERDLAMVVNKTIPYAQLQNAIHQLKIKRLKNMQLFDVFESEKIGLDNKSIAMNFTFLDEEKTLTDKEIDGMMQKITHTLATELNAEIRK